MNFERELAADSIAVIVTIIVTVEEGNKFAVMCHNTIVAGLHIGAVVVSMKLDNLLHSSSASFVEA